MHTSQSLWRITRKTGRPAPLLILRSSSLAWRRGKTRPFALLGSAILVWLAATIACAPAVSREDKLYRMGERVTVGALVYNVFDDQWKAQLGEGTAARVPKDRFFLVRLNVVNGGSSDVMVPTVTLVDDSGQTFPELSNGDGVPSWTGYLRRVKPAESLQGNVVFDAPPKHYRLRVADESGAKTREIDIPLTFTSDAPDMPAPTDQPRQ